MRETTAKLSSDKGDSGHNRAPFVLMGASLGNLGGTGVYTRRLLKGFCTAAEGRVSVAIGRGLVTPEEALRMEPGGGTAHKILQENFLLTAAVRRSRPSLVHLPAFGGRVTGGIPYAVTVHDLAFMRNSTWFPPLRSVYYSLRFKRVAAGAEVVMADSDFTALEIRQLLKIDPFRIRRVYLSTDTFEGDSGTWRASAGLRGDYIVYAGTVEPRKNIEALLGAWKEVKRKHGGLTLVIAGRWGWGPKSLRRSLERTQGVIHTGRLSRKDLTGCISGARLMVYPSYYEGFGLPPLEAASAGVPSVVTPAEVLVEIYGDVARVAEGFDKDSLAEAILDELDTPADPGGLRDFASAFTVEAMAREVLKVYGEFAK